VFSDNQGEYGAAILATVGGLVDLNGCLFRENVGTPGPGALLVWGSVATVTNCTFERNSGSGWGAIAANSASANVTNSTFYANSGEGSAISYVGNSQGTLENNIVAFGQGLGPAISVSAGVVTLACCDIYGNSGGDWVGYIADQYGINGNISLDPLFCDPENGDMTLNSDSPCVDSNHPDGPGTCGLIGSHGIGCGAAGLEEVARMDELHLAPSVPNPFISRSRITYVIPDGAVTARVQLRIYDSSGRLVRTLFDGRQPSGSHDVSWDGTNQASVPVAGGVYFYQLVLSGERHTRRIVLMR
jgi:hypothetical protein